MYILECSDGTYYTGSTINLERRLWEHQNGFGANHTRKRLPVTLVYCEFFDRVSDAFYREKQIQGWNRRKKEALIAGDSNELHELATCRNESHYGRWGSTSRPARQVPERVQSARQGSEVTSEQTFAALQNCRRSPTARAKIVIKKLKNLCSCW
jgi:putative endonuclease